MLYLLDANILITANSCYYPIDQVPEFWSWVQHRAASGLLKIPQEIMEEVLAGRQDNDPLIDWICTENADALTFDETVDANLVRCVVSRGYGNNLTDEQVETIGRDPFLIAYALASPAERCVVTTEKSRPGQQRQNRKIPDVCSQFQVQCCGPFDLNRALGFRTAWRRSGN